MMGILGRLLVPWFLATFLWYYAANLLARESLAQDVLNGLQSGKGRASVVHSLVMAESISSPALEQQLSYYRFRLLCDTSHTKAALELGLELEKSFPGFYDVALNVSRLYFLRGDFESALLWVEKAIDYHPMEEENLATKALILKAMKREVESEKVSKESKELRERNLRFRDSFRW